VTRESLETVKEEIIRLQNKIVAFEVQKPTSFYNYPKETGAIRRASMDLTRALADLRRT